MLMFQILLPIPYYLSRINHSYQNFPMIPLIQLALLASHPCKYSQPMDCHHHEWQSHPRNAHTPAILCPHPSLLSSHHRRQSTAQHFLKAPDFHTFYRGQLSSRILFVSNTKFNKSTRKQAKSRLIPALCHQPDLPTNRAF